MADHQPVVTMGEALFDCLADQLGKTKEEVTSWTEFPGGAPANVATGLARLGAHSVFLGALGKDARGDAFFSLLQGENIVYLCRSNNDKYRFAAAVHAVHRCSVMAPATRWIQTRAEQRAQ
jgi:sugar/nucleoside kinase (ribokinase family)